MARKTKEETERTYHALLDAATALFLRQGVARTTLNDIAGEAGMTRGAIYWHFDNKDAVIKALWERNSHELHEQFVENLNHLDPARPAEHFRQLMKAMLRAAVNDEKVSNAIRIIMHSREFCEEETELQLYLNEKRRRFFDGMNTAISTIAEHGELHSQLAPEVVASGIWSYITGLVHTYLEPGSQIVDLKRHGDELMDWMLDGVLSERRKY